ncbi:MAG: class B sortase [Coriobacteriia bacterium]|nr:class B sortase [Coriobacteriia bacterium]
MAKHAAPEQTVNKKRGKRTFWTVVMVLALIVFVGSAGYLGFIGYSYWSDSNRYDEISDKAFTPGEENGSLADMGVDWAALKEINPEVVAWVYVPGTRISYPVCHSGDNEKYLDVNFDGAAGVFTGSGTIFLDGEANPDFSSECNFLFGHHMNDGSMFACISDFADQEVFNKNRTIYLLTPSQNYEFRSFAIVRTVGTDYLVAHKFSSEAKKVEYIEDKEARSLAQPEGDVPAAKSMEKLIALSTCDYNEPDGRAILFGYVADQAVPKAKASEVVGDAEDYAKPGA